MQEYSPFLQTPYESPPLPCLLTIPQFHLFPPPSRRVSSEPYDMDANGPNALAGHSQPFALTFDIYHIHRNVPMPSPDTPLALKTKPKIPLPTRSPLAKPNPETPLGPLFPSPIPLQGQGRRISRPFSLFSLDGW